jgi:hypothetical protein
VYGSIAGSAIKVRVWARVTIRVPVRVRIRVSGNRCNDEFPILTF